MGDQYSAKDGKLPRIGKGAAGIIHLMHSKTFNRHSGILRWTSSHLFHGLALNLSGSVRRLWWCLDPAAVVPWRQLPGIAPLPQMRPPKLESRIHYV